MMKMWIGKGEQKRRGGEEENRGEEGGVSCQLWWKTCLPGTLRNFPGARKCRTGKTKTLEVKVQLLSPSHAMYELNMILNPEKDALIIVNSPKEDFYILISIFLSPSQATLSLVQGHLFNA